MLHFLTSANLFQFAFKLVRSGQFWLGSQSGPGPRLPAGRQAHSRPPRQSQSLWLGRSTSDHTTYIALSTSLLGLAAGLWLGLAPALAATQPLPPLNQESHINQTLLSAAIGEAIRRNCSTISARMFRVLTRGLALERYARDLGYSRNEIKAFISNKTEKQRMRDQTIVYLKANGVIEGQEQTFCVLGRAEISRNSLTGQLLRSRR